MQADLFHSILFYSILFYPTTLVGRQDEFPLTGVATSPIHLVLFSAALVELAKYIPDHSLILSSHLFFCLPLFLCPFTVLYRIVFAKPEDLETWPNHLRSGVHHILQWPPGPFCKPPHWSHGSCMKCSIVSGNISSESPVIRTKQDTVTVEIQSLFISSIVLLGTAYAAALYVHHGFNNSIRSQILLNMPLFSVYLLVFKTIVICYSILSK